MVFYHLKKNSNMFSNVLDDVAYFFFFFIVDVIGAYLVDEVIFPKCSTKIS